MSRRRTVLLVGTSILCLALGSLKAPDPIARPHACNPNGEGTAAPGVIVGFSDAHALNSWRADAVAIGIEADRVLEALRLVRVSPSKYNDASFQEMLFDSRVEWFESSSVLCVTGEADQLNEVEKNWVANHIHLTEAWETTTGSANVTVAVIDTGVDGDHPQLRGKLQAGVDFIEQDDIPQDDHGHGTQTAGIIAGEPLADGTPVGIAPGVRLLPMKVAHELGAADVLDVAEAICIG